MSYDANVHDSSIEPVFVQPIIEEKEKEGGTDSGSSTIEKSKTVVIPFSPMIDFPILLVPNAGSDKVLAVFLTSDASKLDALQQQLENSAIKSMLDSWNRNLDQIAEQVRNLIKSPAYQAELAQRLHGDDKQVAAPAFLSNLDRIRETQRSESPADDDSRVVTVAFTAAVMVGGALALGSFEVTTTVGGISSAPMTASFEIIEKLQTVMPQLQDLIPYINLMVTPLLYFTSLDTAISNIKSKEHHSNATAAQTFAKEAIKIASDPAYVIVTFVNKMEGAEKFTPEHKKQLAAVLKLILTSVALSLLYSVEVGKSVDGKFWGMEPQEFRDLLNGNIPIGDPNKENLTETQRLKLTLVALIKAQLDALPDAKQKEAIIAVLFEYLTTPREIKTMLDPAKVFHDVLAHLAESESEGVNHLDTERV